MAVGTQRLAVDPRVRYRVDDFIARAAEHLGHDSSARDFDQYDVVEADAVKAVLERDHALDFMRLDHCGQYVAHNQRFFACCDVPARQVVGACKDAAQVVGRMAPFGGEPGIVEIEPANHAADIECCHYRVELERGAGYLGAVRHHRAGNDRAHQLGAGGVGQRLEAAAQRIHQAQSRRVEGFCAFNVVFERVIGDIDDDFIGLGTDTRNRTGHRCSMRIEKCSVG